MTAISERCEEYIKARGMVRDLSTPVTGRKLLEESGEAVVAVTRLNALNELGGCHSFLDFLACYDAAESELACELADVVISADWVAQHFGLTLEECIAIKTEKDRGRDA